MSSVKKQTKGSRVSKKIGSTATEPGAVYMQTQAGSAMLPIHGLRVRAERSRKVYGVSLGMALGDSRQIVAMLRQGLSFEAFERLCAVLEVNQARLAEVCHIAPRTLARREQEGRLQFEESERVYRVAALFERAKEVLGSYEEARRWFKANVRALGGKAPLEYADTEIGAREVEDLLGRLEHGVFS
jgi:putative toxin-antitoxin system antitoxin component (TIGR02293 family)